MKPVRRRIGWLILCLTAAGLACSLTSPTPASWSGTPTAQILANTREAFVLTQDALVEELDLSTPTTRPEIEKTPITKPTLISEGPWLVYSAPSGAGLHAYDTKTATILEIPLPEPVYTADLPRGFSPMGDMLVVRAGSPLNTDELALYGISLPSTEIIKISPLLSLSLQRKIVNQVGTRAQETLQTVTRSDGIAWSPDGRFLAFTAALDNDSSDLYVFDTLNKRVERVNGLYSQNAAPFWSPNSNWLVSQELDALSHPETVSSLRMPGYDDQNTLYLPPKESGAEIFVGWINANTFVSYSQFEDSASTLRQVNVETKGVKIVYQGLFNGAALDPRSRTLAFFVDHEHAAAQKMDAGIYLLEPERSVSRLHRAGGWQALIWDPGGMFIARGSQGVFAFVPQGEGLYLLGETALHLSPNNQWFIAYGNSPNLLDAGARLYQPPSDHPLQMIRAGAIETVLWQPDSRAFFLQSEGALYHYSFPGLKPILIEAGFSSDAALDLVWVE